MYSSRPSSNLKQNFLMINTKKLLYFAYGTNLNKKIFLKKYKNAKYLSKHILKGFELVSTEDGLVVTNPPTVRMSNEQEITENVRARSAVMRVLERKAN
mgnify:CR=1 FL=1